MKNKRKIPKRIFSFFLAILCTFGILFVSYISCFADYTINYIFVYNTTYNSTHSFKLYYKASSSDSWTTIDFSQSNLSGSFSLPVGGFVAFQSDYNFSYQPSFGSSFFVHEFFSFDASLVESGIGTSSDPYVISAPFTLTYTYSRSPNPQAPTSGSWVYIRMGEQVTPTPSFTPAPVTPTPNPYGPGPVPTIPPGEQSYTDFFTRLASDAQSAFNAIFLSWNNANSRFYSGIFFIGLPILLGIIGLVASIFFGDDD